MNRSGSFALLGLLLLSPSVRAEEITYTRHVAPILNKHCAGCHRPGEVGPFSLLSYTDVARRADFLKEITGSRRMPPWKPEPGFGEFLDERRMTDAEIKTIAQWADSGAKQGDPKDLPPLPKFVDGWQLGEPDLIVKMTEPFKLDATGKDVQQCFVIPIPLEVGKFVSAVEFRPGNRKIVHHAIFYLDSTGVARKKDEAEKGPGYHSFGGPGFVPTGGLGAWAPGSTPRHLPDDVGKFLKKGSDLVMQIHYHPNGKENTDQSSLGIYFSKKPVERLVAGIGLRSVLFVIPPGDKRYKLTADSDPLPCDAEVYGIGPHMHLIGREMKVVAVTPDKKEIPMIWIKDWDFNWQGGYAYKEPLKLPKGTVLKMEAYYDNSKDNPFQPSNPPIPVTWGEQTTNEMCLCGVQMLVKDREDLNKIASMRGARLGIILGGGVLPSDLPPEPARPGTPKPGTPKPAPMPASSDLLRSLLESLRKP